MKKILTAIFLMASLWLNAATYYVSPTGNDSNPGTIALPWKTWQKAFNSLSPGDILYVRGGTYTDMYDSGHGVNLSGRDGSSSAPITVAPYPGEVPVLDCSSLSVSSGVNFGILMRNCDYWNIKGLTVKSVREYNNLSKSSGGSPVAAWELGDCSNITLEQCIVTNCGNGFSVNGTVTNIKYKYCDSYGNFDYYDNGGLANGFNGNMRGGSTITYEGCRAWSNSDDGYDDYGGAGYITYKNCWAFGNGKNVPTSGNGDGFKLGYDNSGTELPGSQRTLYNCVSTDNTLMGFDESMDGTTSMDMEIYNCIAYKNSRDYGFRFSVTNGTGVTTLKNNVAYGNGTNYAGRTRNISSHNSWDSGAPAVSDADFISLDASQLFRTRKSDGSLPDVDFSHLASNSDLIDAGTGIGMAFMGTAPDLGAFESGSVAAPQVVTYQSSSVKNATSSQVEVIYDHTLSTVAPAASAYEIKVNSVARAISSLSISGQNVYLNLSNPVSSGDVITLSYTKPASNPLTCSAGTQAESITGKSVSNLVQAPVPTYQSSSVKNSNPSQIEILYDLALSAVTPPLSAYEVKVNSVVMTISSLSISGQNVYLNLSSPVKYGDAVLLSYTKPSANPLQSSSGIQAESITGKSVTNSVQATAPLLTGAVVSNDTPAQIHLTYSENLGSAVPAASAYVAKVNGVTASIQSVGVQYNTVTLTMYSALHYKDTITVSYTQPSANALQSLTGALAASFSNNPVVNSIANVDPGTNPAPVADDSKISITPNPARNYIKIGNFVPGTQEAVLKLFDFSGKLCQEIKLVNYTSETQYQITVTRGVYICQLYSGTIVRHIQKLIILKY